MAILEIINWSTYSRLKGLLDNPVHLQSYCNGEKYSEILKENLLTTTISLPDEEPELHVSKHTAIDDIENAIKVYRYLGSLTRTQAADSRLWATLTHTTFWDYSKKRWPVDSNTSNYVIEHYFEKTDTNSRSLRRNSVSRLWWATHLTIAPWEKESDFKMFKSSDRFKFTRILLAQQQNFQDILERKFGSNLRLRICLLNALGTYQPLVSNKNDLTKDVTKKINLIHKHRQLDAMPVNDLNKLLTSIVKSSVEKIGKII